MTLEEQVQRLTADRDATLKVKCFKCDDGHTPLYCLNCAREGYHHDDEWRPVLVALRLVVEFGICDCNPKDEGKCVFCECEQALAHAEKLISQ